MILDFTRLTSEERSSVADSFRTWKFEELLLFQKFIALSEAIEQQYCILNFFVTEPVSILLIVGHCCILFEIFGQLKPVDDVAEEILYCFSSFMPSLYRPIRRWLENFANMMHTTERKSR